VKLLPSLEGRPNGNKLILSWPTNAVGFKLQSTLDLTPPVTWLDSTSVPAVIGAHFTLTNTTSGGAQFYRLRKMEPAGDSATRGLEGIFRTRGVIGRRKRFGPVTRQIQALVACKTETQ
jgi:hypothetical protein